MAFLGTLREYLDNMAILVKNMKKILVYSFTAILILLLFACEQQNNQVANSGQTQKEEAQETTAPKETNVVKVGVSIYRLDDVFMGRYVYEMADYFNLRSDEDNRYDITIEDAKNDQDEQNSQIDNFIASGCNVLILNLVDPRIAGDVLEKCRLAHMPVVFINREPPEKVMDAYNTGDYAGMYTYVGADARQSGRFQGEIIADLPNRGDINGDGIMKYIMVRGDENNVDAKQRSESSLAKYKEKSGYMVKCLEERSANWKRDLAERVVSGALSKYGNQIEVVFCNNDEMALGAKSAIEMFDRTINKNIYLVGVDGITEAIDAINEGRMTGTVLNDINGQSHAAVDSAIALADGLAQDLYTWVDYIKIIPENASQYK